MNASKLIDDYIAACADWRGQSMTRIRRLILYAAPGIAEEWKWDTPVWSHNGDIVAVGAFKGNVKINFFKGASLQDRQGLFNAGLDAKKSRAIDLFENDEINADALKDLIRAAVALNNKEPKRKGNRKRGAS